MGNRPSNHNWFFGRTEDSDVEVYCDYDILGGFESQCKNKFLWICESKVVVPDQMRILRERKDDFLDVYKAVFVHDTELLNLDDRFVYAPPAANVTWVVPDKQKIYNKTKLVSMVSSGKSFSSGHTFRNNLMVSLKEKCSINASHLISSTEPLANGSVKTSACINSKLSLISILGYLFLISSIESISMLIYPSRSLEAHPKFNLII
jgi:hypothetical protein